MACGKTTVCGVVHHEKKKNLGTWGKKKGTKMREKIYSWESKEISNRFQSNPAIKLFHWSLYLSISKFFFSASWQHLEIILVLTKKKDIQLLWNN